MKYTFQHFMDISTSANSVNIISIKAGGEYVRTRCKHLFSTYKYWKLGKLQVKLIPASCLPVDPLGLAYGDTDPQTVDPRDQLSPGLVRITNGENILKDLTDTSEEEQRQMYTNTLLDPRWSKFMLQTGFKRTAVPLAFDVGQLEQTIYADMTRNIPDIRNVAGEYQIYDTDKQGYTYNGDLNALNKALAPGSDPRGLFQLGHKKRMGWMPTDSFERYTFTAQGKEGTETRSEEIAALVPIPEIDCITVILPRAYKTIYYYRLFITETVYFSGIKNVGVNVYDGDSPYEYRSFDNLSFSLNPYPAKPSKRMSNIPNVPSNPNDGGS